MKVICPDCGSDELRSNDVVLSTHDIASFDADGVPEFSDNGSEIWYDSMEPAKPLLPYECCNCMRPFSVDEIKKLLVDDNYFPEDDDGTP